MGSGSNKMTPPVTLSTKQGCCYKPNSQVVSSVVMENLLLHIVTWWNPENVLEPIKLSAPHAKNRGSYKYTLLFACCLVVLNNVPNSIVFSS